MEIQAHTYKHCILKWRSRLTHISIVYSNGDPDSHSTWCNTSIIQRTTFAALNTITGDCWRASNSHKYCIIQHTVGGHREGISWQWYTQFAVWMCNSNIVWCLLHVQLAHVQAIYKAEPHHTTLRGTRQKQHNTICLNKKLTCPHVCKILIL